MERNDELDFKYSSVDILGVGISVKKGIFVRWHRNDEIDCEQLVSLLNIT